MNQREFVQVWEDKEAKILSDVLLENNISNAYLFEEKFWLSVPMIQFYYTNKQEQIKFATSLPTSTRYMPFDESSGYDCIVTSPSQVSIVGKSYKELYRTSSFIIWGR